jgi:hypothetical protein
VDDPQNFCRLNPNGPDYGCGGLGNPRGIPFVLCVVLWVPAVCHAFSPKRPVRHDVFSPNTSGTYRTRNFGTAGR